MAAYSHYLGRTVTVQYRLGEILLSASGVFVGDSGRSIFLEQHLLQRGKQNYFRWEIPYTYIHSVQVLLEAERDESVTADATAEKPHARAAAAASGSSSSSVTSLPFSQPSKTA